MASLGRFLPAALAGPAVPPAKIAHPNRSCANGHIHNLIAGNAILHQDANGRFVSGKANSGGKTVRCRLFESLQVRKSPLPLDTNSAPASTLAAAEAQDSSGSDHRQVGQFRKRCHPRTGRPVILVPRGVR
jgi:hypothetical protein